VTDRRLAAILSADAVGYSRLMSEDEDATVAALGVARRSVQQLVPEHHGRLVDFNGDNFLAEFPSALDGARCAVASQEGFVDAGKLRFRIGLHLGDVRVEGERIYGDGVNIAARLEGLAEPGGICLSAAVHEQVAPSSNSRSRIWASGR
jgi:adenylate cyclase